MRDFYGDDSRGRLLASKLRLYGYAGRRADFESRWLRAHPPAWWASRVRNGQKGPWKGLYVRFPRKQALEDVS